MERFIKGADVSSLLDVEECGGRFYDQSLGTRHQSLGTRHLLPLTSYLTPPKRRFLLLYASMAISRSLGPKSGQRVSVK